MTTRHPTNEQLMAYADGVLPVAEAAGLTTLIDSDPELQAKVEMYRASRQLVRDTLRPLAEESVPETLQQSIKTMIAESGGDNVVTFRRPQRRPPMQRPWALPLAASLIAAIAGLGGYGLGLRGGGDARLASVGDAVPRALAQILDTRASGTDTALAAERVRMIATVRTKDGGVCREFEVVSAAKDTLVGIACRSTGGWRLDVAVAAAQTAEGFAPASSIAVADSYLDSIGASEPLPADEEAAVLAGGH
jgi:hypothetical protein